MKSVQILLVFVVLLLTFPAVNAQVTASELLEWTEQHLNKGDCDKARETYELYKEKVPLGNAEVERQIAECGNKTQSIIPKGYVDLGLPSGTLWKEKNENGFYDYFDAVAAFDGKLPSKEQWMELMDRCIWTWNGSGYIVVGTNGQSIVLPASGYRNWEGAYFYDDAGRYWSSTPNGENELGAFAWCLYFYNDRVDMSGVDYAISGSSVRLIYK